MELIILIIVIVGILISLIQLLRNLQREKIRFEKKETKLLNTIVIIKNKQNLLNQQVKISEEFNVNYIKSRSLIAESIYEANLEFIKKSVEKNNFS
jgi:predicted Holliday junction resolvase-like endonuclease